ncbi:MAG: oligosaccharide flippase family protein [Actinomycetota bacterium]|nr:oligosaccharide flippase family protein [Actinomycetota bacterium]
MLSTDARAASRGGTALLLFQALARALALVFVFVVTRQLGPTEFGRYSIAAGLVLMGSMFADFGTTPAVTKLVSRDPESSDGLLAGTLPVSFALGLLAAAGVITFAVVAGYAAPLVADVAIAAAGIPAASAGSSILGALDGRGMIARRAVVTLLQSSVIAVGGMLAVVAGAGVRGAVLALGVAPMVSLLLSAVWARRAGVWRRRPQVDVALTVRLMKVALPFAAIMGCYAFSARFDVVVLSIFRSQADTAAYDLAQRLVESLWFISAALTGPALFILSRRLGSGDVPGARRAFREAARVMYLVSVPVTVVLVLLARPAVTLALGPEYAGAVLPFSILAATLWLVFIVQLQTALVNAGDHARAAMGTAACVAGVTVALDLVLVPTMGGPGAALAMVGSSLVAAFLYTRVTVRRLGIPMPLPPASAVIAAAVMAVPLVMLSEWPVPAAMVAAAAYAGTVAATGGVDRRDLERVRTLARWRA